MRQHRISVAIIVAVVALAAVANSWYITTQLQSIQANQEVIAAATHQAALYSKEAAEAQAKAQAEAEAAAKKAAEEAAKQAAEDAKRGATSDSSACNTALSHNNPAAIDVVVNKKHCIRPLDFAPPDLSTQYGATLSTQAMSSFVALYTAAQADGQPFYVTSSYRSYTKQIATYNSWVAKSGVAGADTYSARAGYSEHQTGLAMDVAVSGCTLDCFGSTTQYAWFQEHAADYGFIQRYYKGSESITGYSAEEWHYRFVGVAVAKDMKSKGIKTLEQYWGVSGGDYY